MSGGPESGSQVVSAAGPPPHAADQVEGRVLSVDRDGVLVERGGGLGAGRGGWLGVGGRV